MNIMCMQQCFAYKANDSTV